MFRSSQHGNGLSATLFGSLGRLALGVVLSVAVCLVVSIVLGAGCGGQKEESATTAKETASAPVVTSTPAPVPVPDAATTTEVQPVLEQKPVVTEKRVATPKPVVTPKPAPVSVSEVAPAPQPVVLAIGTVLESTLESSVATDKNAVGDAVTLRTSQPVVAEGRTVVPAGAVVHGRVTHVRSAGRMKGAAELTVRFTELELPTGERVAITCDPLRRVAKGDGRETAAEIGAGAVVGGALGGVLGGKDDVLKGAAVGAVVGTGLGGRHEGAAGRVAGGQTVKVTLTAPLTLPANTNS